MWRRGVVEKRERATSPGPRLKSHKYREGAMRLKLATAAVIGVLVAAIAVPASTASADVSQTPVTTGCASGYQRLRVDFLESQGPSPAPRLIDPSPQNIGYVCALALPEAVRLKFCGPDCPVPVLYQFFDDDNPAQQNAQVDG